MDCLRRWRVHGCAGVLAVFGMAVPVAVADDAELPLPLMRQSGEEQLPDFVFEERLADGTSRDLGFVELRGTPIVATLWATWCGVCRGELPKLDALQKDLRSDGVLIAALSIDDGGIAVASAALAKRGLSELRAFHDTDKMLFVSVRAWGVPTTVIADAAGRIVARANGPVAWDSPEVRRFLASLKTTERVAVQSEATP